MWTTVLTTCAMVAFAANSVLCRLALGNGAIDPASFSAVRLVSGAATLWIILAITRGRQRAGDRGSWPSAFWLFLYAAPFSFAYVSLSTGTGALILFGAVQTTMILIGLLDGERPRPAQWAGLALALGGLAYLLVPGLTAPPLIGSILMAVAGISWGVYSLRGRGVKDPTIVTTDNFIRSVPMVLGLALLALPTLSVTGIGLLWAVVSGSLASGLGYVIWYAALRGLTATRAATVQLAVPVLAALGGVWLLAEPISIRLVVSGAAILGGIALAVTGRE